MRNNAVLRSTSMCENKFQQRNTASGSSVGSLSRKEGPTSSYATTNISLNFIRACKSPHLHAYCKAMSPEEAEIKEGKLIKTPI